MVGALCFRKERAWRTVSTWLFHLAKLFRFSTRNSVTSVPMTSANRSSAAASEDAEQDLHLHLGDRP